MMEQTKPIDISQIDTHSERIEKCYTVFKDTVFNKDNPLILFGKCVSVSFVFIEGKADKFWHSGSLGLNYTFSVFPCNNDISNSICNKNCLTHEYQINLNDNIRDICYYRMTRINFIKEIIKLANNKDKHIKIWEKRDSKTAKTKLLLRYNYLETDYLIVFSIKLKKYILESAYPLFYINSKATCDKEYESYKRQKIKTR